MALKMSDIAKMAKVSRSAVSLALNNKPGISDETRKKIFKVIEESGYTPLRKRKKGGLRRQAVLDLIMVSDKSGILNRNYASLPFFDTLVADLTQNVSGFGGKLQITTISSENLKEEILELKASVKAAIVLATDLDEKQVTFINKNLKHVVFLDTYYENIDADFVSINNKQGAYLAGKYIVEKGYTNIGYVASNKIISNFLYRREGFRKAIHEANLKIDAANVYSVDPTKLIPNYDLNEEQVKKLPRAIFCEDDYMALRFIKELRKYKIKVPEEVAIIGFDDISEDTMIMPELTTIHVAITQMVDQAVNQILAQIDNKDWLAQKTLVSTKLIKRQSM
ncbi:LacI family DNA-binding transcriptional regulator [Lactobacillus mulieris]|uniref:LacI family DNA-binding transcriptional regulator n=1 Tax=Lactobacillus mulieris TaxID=2508708 RepID=A0AAW5WY61_9LACO|nr:LacI family DNA-binding transcriptional regulator [Lactobacillus mulieris]MCZ3621689.1 LacI family DNA-binding transcriptional regulator [Lactobacillus mulieris]MCZ3623035.1 LacI family DNA-binding transcriptional regulator [Lactobacillus mulieris]MCZ3635696.1 LacI family DNA-binding transcriptional regulator [Lactobacillus mulieris]MCZ3690095.1 LacI family DNA-binding transcriptional regulator [Lactobacillus mulieris]MCZ3696033.1 LacI family DNA-binding transcriptional regulator [Lactobaci